MSKRLFQEEHQVFREAVRKFVENEMRPDADRWEEAGEPPRELFSRMGELGYLGMRFPEEYGGGNDIIYEAVLHEELARGCCGGAAADIGAHIALAMPHILAYGTAEQKQRYLVPGIRGEKTGCLAITEPDAGSDVASIRTRAVPDGSEWVVNGTKTFITNGSSADFTVLAASTDPGSGYSGISMFVVDTSTPGYSVSTKLNKLGWKSSGTAEISFDDLRVGADALLGKVNQGFYQIMGMFPWERISLALSAVSTAEYTMERTLEYARRRQAFGKPVSRFQVISHYFADMATQVEAGRRLVYHALEAYLAGENCIREAAMAKLFCGRMACEVTDRCIQIHGGHGYMEDYGISRAYRDVRLVPIGGGTDEIMREIISKALGM